MHALRSQHRSTMTRTFHGGDGGIVGDDGAT